MAQIFDESSGSYLSTLGFELVEDPAEIRNPYQATVASYGTDRGLFLTVGFEPLDGCSASMHIGRRWKKYGPGYQGDRTHYRLSNGYSVLAKRFGFEVPSYYELHHGDDFLKDVAHILKDLKRTLQEMIAKTSLADLIEIEAEEYGARKWYEKLSPKQAALVEIERFDDGRGHPSQTKSIKGD